MNHLAHATAHIPLLPLQPQINPSPQSNPPNSFNPAECGCGWLKTQYAYDLMLKMLEPLSKANIIEQMVDLMRELQSEILF